MSRKRYVGNRTADGAAVVIVDESGERPLDPRLDVRNHSPTGFEWGYAGSGPAQLALAICIDALDGDVERACASYQNFKNIIINHLARDYWSMPLDQVVLVITDVE